MSISYLNNHDSGLQARDIINELVDVANTFRTGSYTGSFTGSLQGTATTASFTPNALVTASVSSNVITFTKGNGTTFPITVDTGSSASTNTGSLLTTASVASNIITFTKGDGSTFPLTVDTGSGGGSPTPTGSLLVTASATLNIITFTKGDGSTFPLTVDTGSGGTAPGGLNTQIQFNSGSVFSGSSNFTYNYIDNTAILTGSLLVTGSTTLTGSFGVHNSLNGGFYPTFENPTNGTNTETGFTVVAGNGISGSFAYIGTTPKGYTANTHYAGSTVFTTAPANASGDSTRNMRQIFNISGTPAASSFEWHYQSTYILTAGGLKMKLDVPSGLLSNSGSITTSGSLTIASGSSNTNGDSAIYFGSSGSVGSWRIAPSGSNLVIQKWNGTFYTQSGIFS